MNITVLSLSFSPDHSGISNYATGFSTFASESGHNVQVITGYPFYPQWKKRKEHRRKLFSTERFGKVNVLRGYLYVPKKPTLVKRLLQEFTFLISAFFNFCRGNRPDVIVVFTTPISIGWLAILFKYLFRCKLVINVQDFQLEAASSLNMIQENFFFRMLKKMELYSYKKADLVSSISKSMYDILVNNKNVPTYKACLWPNWVDAKDYDLSQIEQGLFRKKYNLGTKDIVVAYAGNVGLKQGLETLIDLAERFKMHKQINFFIVGQGSALEVLKEYASRFQNINIQFIPLLNSKEYVEFLADIDVFYLPQKKTDFDVYFPSKLLGLMAAGKNLLLAADKQSELYKTVRSNEIGHVAEFGNFDMLSKLLTTILLDDAITDRVKNNMKSYVANFQTEKVLMSVLNVLELLINTSGYQTEYTIQSPTLQPVYVSEAVERRVLTVDQDAVNIQLN